MADSSPDRCSLTGTLVLGQVVMLKFETKQHSLLVFLPLWKAHCGKATVGATALLAHGLFHASSARTENGEKDCIDA